MKFAGNLRYMLCALAVGALTLTLTGCGFLNFGGGGHHDLSLTQGNWSFAATSSVPANGTFYVGGNLTQNGTNLSGKLYFIGSLCLNPSQAIAFTGTVKGSQVTLISTAVQGQVLAITATGSAGSLSGTYTLSAGGNCQSNDAGTVTANAMPSITGTWNGPITNDFYGDPNAVLSIALTQASTASADGTFALSGTLTYTGSSCSVSGTISSGSVFGPQVQFDGVTTEQGGGQGGFSYTLALLDSTTAPKNMTGDYFVSAGLCQGDENQSQKFTKQ